VEKSKDYSFDDMTFVEYKLFKNNDIISFDVELLLEHLGWKIGDTLEVFRDHQGRVALTIPKCNL